MAGMQPSATLAPTTVNLPDQAISVAGQLNQFNALQPTQCYEMSVSCRKAVSCIVNEASRAKLRIFTRNGDEVVDGPLVKLLKNPLKNWSTKRFITDIMSWHLIEGEIAVGLELENGKPVSMLPLAPNRLYPIDPTTPNEISDIRQWFYTWNDGYTDQIQNADVFRPKPKTVPSGWLGRQDSVRYTPDCLIFAPNFNPYSHVRGLSPFVTGVNAASVNYQALRYMKDFYTNNAVPSHIIELKKNNNSKKQLEDWKEKYLEQYATRNANSQKVMVSSGGELTVHKLDNDHKTAEEIDLLNYTDEQVMVLFSIPPIVFGHSKQTRFETAAQERSQFLEATILPVCNVVADVLQFQLVDRFFSLSPVTGYGKNIKNLTKSLRGLVEKRLDERPASEYVVVMDPDPIPLMTQVRIDQANAVDAVCLKMRMSVNEACEWLHIEIPQSPLRDKILVSNTLAELTAETFPPQPPREAERDPHTVALDRKEKEGHSNDESKRTQAEASKEAKKEPAKPAANAHNVSAKAKSLARAYRSLRAMTIKSMDEQGRLYSLSDVDAEFHAVYDEVPAFKIEVRKDLFHLRNLTKKLDGPARVDAVREFYREKRPAVLREVAERC